MSKLADRIRSASSVERAPIGFGISASRKPASTMLCLLRLSSGQADRAAEAVAQGADAVIFDRIGGKKLNEQGQEADRPILGVWLSGADRSAVVAQREAGADFVVVEWQSASAEVHLEEGIGLVLELGLDASDTTLRLLADLPLDALVVPAPAEPLTLARLMEVRRLAALSRTTLLMEIGEEIGISRLQALRDAGVVGVILADGAQGRLAGLREAIEALPARGRRREDRVDAILPNQGSAAGSEGNEEDEEIT